MSKARQIVNRLLNEGVFDRFLGYSTDERIKEEVDCLVATVKPFHISQAMSHPNFGCDVRSECNYETWWIVEHNPSYISGLKEMKSRILRLSDQQKIENMAMYRIQDMVFQAHEIDIE